MRAYRCSATTTRRVGITTRDLFASAQGSRDHCRGTSHAAFYRDRARRAVELASAAFHARLPAHQPHHTPVHGEYTVRADDAAQRTADAQLWVVCQCVDSRYTDHFLAPSSHHTLLSLRATAGSDRAALSRPSLRAIPKLDYRPYSPFCDNLRLLPAKSAGCYAIGQKAPSQ